MDYYDEKLQRSGKDLKGCFFCLLAMICIGLAGFIWGRCTTPPQEVKSDTVTKVKWDTIHDTVPDIRYETIVRTITRSLTDTIFKVDTLTNEITMDVVQRKYSDDSSYTAYVSGVKIDSFPRLDSINVYQKTIERTITNTIYKKKHWRFGLGATAGVSATTGKPDIVIGGFLGFTF